MRGFVQHTRLTEKLYLVNGETSSPARLRSRSLTARLACIIPLPSSIRFAHCALRLQSLVFVFAFICMGCTTLDMLKATQIARKAAEAACRAEPLLAGFSGFAIGAVETSSASRGLTITSTQTRLVITVEAK